VAIVIEKSRLYFDKVESERLAAIGLSLSEIAHYIKNLLQGMAGGQYFLETGLKRDDLEKARKGWEMLDRNQKKISNLVQNMLNFSRSSSLQFEMENLNGLLYDLARDVEESAQRRMISLKVLLDDTIPEIPMAYDALHEAVLNLVTNAIDAIPEGRPGTVTIASRLDLAAEVARIGVTDSGVGISDEQKKRMFKLFYSTKGRRGTGIGLAVTRKIIEEHRGRIAFASELGKGTTFTVELPLARKND
jgi:signal transduction histidine kinase